MDALTFAWLLLALLALLLAGWTAVSRRVPRRAATVAAAPIGRAPLRRAITSDDVRTKAHPPLLERSAG